MRTWCTLASSRRYVHVRALQLQDPPNRLPTRLVDTNTTPGHRLQHRTGPWRIVRTGTPLFCPPFSAFPPLAPAPLTHGVTRDRTTLDAEVTHPSTRAAAMESRSGPVRTARETLTRRKIGPVRLENSRQLEESRNIISTTRAASFPRGLLPVFIGGEISREISQRIATVFSRKHWKKRRVSRRRTRAFHPRTNATGGRLSAKHPRILGIRFHPRVACAINIARVRTGACTCMCTNRAPTPLFSAPLCPSFRCGSCGYVRY